MRDQSGSQTMTVDANDPRAQQQREILRDGNVAGFGNGNVETGAASSSLPAPPLPSPLHPPTILGPEPPKPPPPKAPPLPIGSGSGHGASSGNPWVLNPNLPVYTLSDIEHRAAAQDALQATRTRPAEHHYICLLYTSDAADE